MGEDGGEGEEEEDGGGARGVPNFSVFYCNKVTKIWDPSTVKVKQGRGRRHWELRG